MTKKAAAKKARVGERIPVQMRRIGATHAVVTLGTAVELLDVQQLDATIAKLTRALASQEEQRVKTQTKLDELRAARKAFDALEVDRDDDDPEVP